MGLDCDAEIPNNHFQPYPLNALHNKWMDIKIIPATQFDLLSDGPVFREYRLKSRLRVFYGIYTRKSDFYYTIMVVVTP